jgi:hypothetical protein
MQHAWEMSEVLTKLWLGNLEARDLVEDTDVDYKISLQEIRTAAFDGRKAQRQTLVNTRSDPWVS